MRFKKRKKASRFRGSHTHGRGFKKKARGSGHQGGKGMAGTGKRGDAKKTLILNLYGNDYFGKDKTLRRGNKAPKLKVINLGDIERNLPSYLQSGLAKDNKGVIELTLKDHKILSEGNVVSKIHITAGAASSGAQEKIKKAGGELHVVQKAAKPKATSEEKAPAKSQKAPAKKA